MGLPDPSFSSFPRLSYLLKGIRRSIPSSPRAKRLPITPDILKTMHMVWSQYPVTFNKVMLWAACCMVFFGFMREGEFTCRSPNTPPDDTLSVSDISIDSRVNPQVLIVRLRHSKTDPFGAGVNLYLGRTGNTLCPVAAVLGYLAIRPSTPGPLFHFQDGTPLSRTHLVTHIRDALSRAGIDASQFSGHSFRIGAASTAAQAGLNDSLIQMLGRWKLSAFTAHIRTPVKDLIAVASRLVRP